MRSVDKESVHVVLFSADLEFAVWDVDSVLTFVGVTMEDESIFINIEEVPDLLVFAEEWVLFERSEVAFTPSGFLGFIPDEVQFI